MLLKTSVTAEGIAPVAGLAFELGATTAAPSANEAVGIDFGVGGLHMHDVLDFPGRDEIERRRED
jgi:hypothetical protein